MDDPLVLAWPTLESPIWKKLVTIGLINEIFHYTEGPFTLVLRKSKVKWARSLNTWWFTCCMGSPVHYEWYPNLGYSKVYLNWDTIHALTLCSKKKKKVMCIFWFVVVCWPLRNAHYGTLGTILSNEHWLMCVNTPQWMAKAENAWVDIFAPQWITKALKA